MNPPSVSIGMRTDVFFPGEPAIVDLDFPGWEEIELPPFEARMFCCRPGHPTPHEFRLNAEEVADRRVCIDGHLPALEPGRYAICCRLFPGPDGDTGSPDVVIESNLIEWSREPLTAITAAVGPALGGRPPACAYCIASGLSARALFRVGLYYDDQAPGSQLQAGCPERVRVLAGHTSPALAVNPAGDLCAWLEDEGVHAATYPLGFFERVLPGNYSQLLSSLLAGPDAAADVFAIGQTTGGAALSRIAMDAVSILPPPVRPPPTDDWEPEAYVEVEPDRVADRISAPEPRVAWTAELPEDATGVAVAAGRHAGERTGVAYIVPTNQGVELHFSWLDPASGPNPSHFLLIPNALVLPGCRTAVHIDAAGEAQVAIALRQPRGDAMSADIGIARVRFAASGRPVLDLETGFRVCGTLSEPPLAAAVAFWEDSDDDSSGVDVAIALSKDRCFVSRRVGPAQIVNTALPLTRPLQLVSLSRSWFAAANQGTAAAAFIQLG
jgi:hypothetical protein